MQEMAVRDVLGSNEEVGVFHNAHPVFGCV